VNLLFIFQSVSTPENTPAPSDNVEHPSTSQEENLNESNITGKKGNKKSKKKQVPGDVQRQWAKKTAAQENANSTIGYHEVPGPSRQQKIILDSLSLGYLVTTRTLYVILQNLLI
jgi:hypothetical protein